MKDNYFDAMPYKFEFTLEEVDKLVLAIARAIVNDERYIKAFKDDKELVGDLKKEIDIFQAILDKLRRPA